LAVTLFRSTRRTVHTEGEPDGLLLGRVRVKQFLLPLDGKPDRVQLCELGQQQTAGLHTVQVTQKLVNNLRAHKEISAEAALPAQGSFFALEGRAVVSSAGMVGGALEVRLFNPTGKKQTASLRFGATSTFQQGWPVDLLSEPLGEPQALEDGVYSFGLRPKQIVTLRFQ
jgi:alpha-mannosidase/mannosylglycerate hydrolase